MTIVVKSDNGINSTKAKLSHSKKHNNKSKSAAFSSSTKNLVNIQPKPSHPFILPCQSPFVYSNTNSAVVAAQQQLFSLQLLMSSPYFAQALASINANNSNSGNTFVNKNNTNTANNAVDTPITSNSTADPSRNNTANDTNIPSTTSNPVSMPTTSSEATNNATSKTKLASSAPSTIPPNPLSFLPPNISLPYLAAALANANQQILNGGNNKTNKTTNTQSTNPSSTNKNSSKDTKINPSPQINSSLLPKSDNVATNALLLNNSLLTNQFIQFLQQQQQQQPNNPLIVNPFTIPSSHSILHNGLNASSTTNPININSSFPSNKTKSKHSSSSLKFKNSKLSTSPNTKSKKKLPIKKDPMTISKNHRRTSISHSYDPKSSTVNSLFNMINTNNVNNINKLNNGINNTTNIKRENDQGNKDHDMVGLESTSPSTNMATSPLLPISIPFSNLNIHSNSGSSPVMKSNTLPASSLSTLCTVASQEAKLFIPQNSSEEKNSNYTSLPSSIKEEENEKGFCKDTNIFSKLDTCNRNTSSSSLLTKNIQSQKIMENGKKMNNIESTTSKGNDMDEDKKPEITNSTNLAMSLPMPISIPPMSLPTITINTINNKNAMDKKPILHSFTASTIPSSPQSPSASSSTSSSSSTSPKLYHNGHPVPHTALQRRKSRSMSCSKDYVCELCKPNKCFVQLAHLRIHQRKHTGERPFVCSYCNKSFAQQGNLKTHQRKHTGERPFTCPICFKTFTQSGNLKQHELVHQGVRPFVCEWCDKTFTQSGNLKTHQMKIHPELMQYTEDGSILRSPVNSSGGRSRRHSQSHTHLTHITTTSIHEEDQMMIDHDSVVPETEEKNSQMMIDDKSSNTTQVSEQKYNSGFDGQIFGMDNDDYDEIQSMESGVVCPNTVTTTNDEGYDDDNSDYPNDPFKEDQDNDDDEERGFDNGNDEDEDEKLSKYNSIFEGNVNNPPENNIKERQLLKRLKALLKRN
ncbi:hypothetical protein BCR36DRAFT_281891 [Piromyces finnis]|uniref:C2H2-type domain-containing protein n=1 Tax=Piromyces finnis TaxID=1754191 RepID=A0A1Y1VFQ0_9FUNG|nr:hypothetical protein BCR36DRAFT_281891 [Piromyces finnis]|eukprot:ORX55246.1 hypothetical protein BCR36DRAFT_281891 [Piromyces finnis]